MYSGKIQKSNCLNKIDNCFFHMQKRIRGRQDRADIVAPHLSATLSPAVFLLHCLNSNIHSVGPWSKRDGLSLSHPV